MRINRQGVQNQKTHFHYFGALFFSTIKFTFTTFPSSSSGISVSAVLFTLLLVMDLQMDTGYSGQHLVYPSHGRVRFGAGNGGVDNPRDAFNSFQKRFLQRANASHVPSREVSNSLNLFDNVVKNIETRGEGRYEAVPNPYDDNNRIDENRFEAPPDSARYDGDRNDLVNRHAFAKEAMEKHDNFADLNDFLINNPVSGMMKSGKRSGGGGGGSGHVGGASNNADSGPLEDPIIVVSDEDSELDNPTLKELLGLELP